MASFKVTPEENLNVAAKLEGWTDSYAACVNRIYQVAQDLPQSWGGTAQASYVSQLSEFQNDFQALYNLFNKYATFLRASASNYTGVEENIAAAAKNLQVGN